LKTNSYIVEAGVLPKRLPTDCRVDTAGGVVEKRLRTDCRVTTASALVRTTTCAQRAPLTACGAAYIVR
jgi:hypothetical protein